MPDCILNEVIGLIILFRILLKIVEKSEKMKGAHFKIAIVDARLKLNLHDYSLYKFYSRTKPNQSEYI